MRLDTEESQGRASKRVGPTLISESETVSPKRDFEEGSNDKATCILFLNFDGCNSDFVLASSGSRTRYI